MLNKQVLLGLFTICCLLFAVLLYTRDPLSVPVNADKEVFIPGLVDALADVQSILIESNEDDVIIKKINDQWKVASKSDYPANITAISQLLYGVAELEILEVKTSNELRLGEIGLGKNDDDSVRVRFMDQNNDSVADILFGQSQVSLSGEGKDWFIRQYASPQSWLVKGRLNLYKTSDQWLDRTILSLSKDELSLIELYPETTERVSITNKDGEYALVDVVDNTQVNSSRLKELVTTIRHLQFDDVRLKADSSVSNDAHAINITTVDGVIILILVTDSEQGWIMLQAIAASSAEKALQQAQNHNRLWAGWEYRVGKQALNQFLTKKSMLMQAQDEK